ncbi:MAG: type II toxin-antitoxin system VapB family antitoxin [Myxococcales bacterium]|nr:type II toxin-antitoxin system VapB family antitoxin [Myxococcales bacterium]
MSVQIDDVTVIAKIEALARATRLGKTAAVELALDRMLAELGDAGPADPWAGLDALLAQLHRMPVRVDAFDAVQYDENGLPL